MTTNVPLDTNILLWRSAGSWKVFASYPSNTAGPVPFDPLPKKDLAAAYDFLLQFHNDAAFPGSEATHDTTSSRSNVADGSLLRLTLSQFGWTWIILGPSGGLVQNMTTYRSIGACFQTLRNDFNLQ